MLSDGFCSLDDAKALKRGKAFGHTANSQSLKQNYGRGAPALKPCCARMPSGHAAAALPRKMNPAGSFAPVGAEEMPRDYQFFAPTALDRRIAIS